MGYRLDALLARPDVDQRTRSELRDIRLGITSTLADLRRQLFELRRNHSNLKVELESLYHSLSSGFGGSCDVEEVALPQQIERVIIECARELLTNAVRHSGGGNIWLSLMSTHNRVTLTVSDDGKGGAALGTQRFGLVGVVEKVTELGGRCEILGKRGSTITVSLPH